MEMAKFRLQKMAVERKRVRAGLDTNSYSYYARGAREKNAIIKNFQFENSWIVICE